MTRLAIEARGLGKAYRRYGSALSRAVDLVTLGRAGLGDDRWVLQDIDLEVPRGSALGVIGANGAGKSTLLSVLAGLTEPTAGRFRIDGRSAALIELGAGFHLDFTGRENIQQDGVLRGIPRSELLRREAEICAFAEIGSAIDEPVRTYSQGMGMRLAFAIAMAAEPDVLLVDEVFAVGDLRFQKKCADRLGAFQERGGTLLFCSHSLYDVRQLCDQALWIDAGRLRAYGDAVEVTGAYAAASEPGVEEGACSASPSTGGPRFTSVEIVDRAGVSVAGRTVTTGESLEVQLRWDNPTSELVHVAVAFERPDRTILAAAGTQFERAALSPGAVGARLELEELGFLAGSFSVRVVLFDGQGVHRYDERSWDARLEVRAATREVGLVRLPHRWRIAEAEVAA